MAKREKVCIFDLYMSILSHTHTCNLQISILVTVEEIKEQKTIVVSKLDKNLSTKQTLALLEKEFGYYGKIVNIKCPSVNDRIKGYAFIEFKMMKKAKRAVADLSKKKKFSCSMKKSRDEYLKLKDGNNTDVSKSASSDLKNDGAKNKKQQKKSNKKDVSEEEKEEDEAANDIMRLAIESAKNSLDDEDDDDEDGEMNDLGGDGDLSDRINSILEKGENDDEDDDAASKKKKHAKKNKGPDYERTLFIRNLPFDVEVDDIVDMFSYYYGAVEKVTVMPHKEFLNLSNGTAFVLFEKKESADSVMKDVEMEQRLKNLETISKSPKFEQKLKQMDHHVDSQSIQGSIEKLELEGRHPIISRAISRDEASKKKEQMEKIKMEEKDRRNLYLAEEGYVPKSSPIAATLPPKHLEKIQKNYETKMQKLNNPIYHISRTRLSVQNLPKTMTDKQLKELFLRHAEVKDDTSVGPPKVKYSRIERDKNSKHIDAAGNPPSRGYGFVEFEKHEHALAALRAINNNPGVFEKKRVKKDKVDDSRRLIVEFALDNVKKLQQRNTRLRMEKDIRSGKISRDDALASKNSGTKRKRENDKKGKKPNKQAKNTKKSNPSTSKSSKKPSSKKTKK